MTTPAWPLVSSSNEDGDDVVMDNEDDMVTVGLGFASPLQQQQQHHVRDHMVQELLQGMQPCHLTTRNDSLGSHGHDNGNNNSGTRSQYQPESIRGAINEESSDQATATNDNNDAIQFQLIPSGTGHANGDDFTAAAVKEDEDDETMATKLAAQEAMVRAQAIIQKFGIRSSTASCVDAATSPSTITGSCAATSIVDLDCKRRRDHCLEQERVRLDKALLQNWEYLAKREEQRLQHQLRLMDAAKQLEHDQVQRRVLQTKLLEQQQKEHRNGHLASSQAGIGTLEQRNRKRKANQQLLRQQQEQDCASSLYLSNLSSTTSIDVIRNLFQSYGTIKRVHFYSNKATGLLKGDGLVTYETNKENEITTDFLQSVCQQVSFFWPNHTRTHTCPS